MDLNAIIAALKARCPSFGGRVAGAAEYKRLPEAANLVMPAAYVVPADDQAENVQSTNGYRQLVTDSIFIVVVLSNTADERGQSTITEVNAIRAELWAALLGWEPDADHSRLEYEGGNLLDLDRARLYYQFEFSAETEIAEADTWQGDSNAALPAFTEVGLTVNVPGSPDTVEATATIPVPQV